MEIIKINGIIAKRPIIKKNVSTRRKMQKSNLQIMSHNMQYMTNCLSQKHQTKTMTAKTFIADSSSTPHTVNLEEIMTNLKDAKKRVTASES